MPVFRDMVVHESRVKAGSQITLLGTSNEHQSKDKVIHWFKDKRPIPFESTPKYIFFNAGEILVINEFMSEDIGQYVCIFSNNSTLKGTVFKLSLLPPSGEQFQNYVSKYKAFLHPSSASFIPKLNDKV